VKDRIRDSIIPHLIAELNKEKIAGLPEYEQRLRNNAGNEDVFRDLFLEADAAVMFRRHGFEVTMRDKPDLKIELDGEVVYAEVTHFRKKERDRVDELAMQDSEDLVPVGILTPTEGAEAWDQLACKAKRKATQYVEGAPNILVVKTSSNAMRGTILGTAVHVFNKWAANNDQLQRLNAFILIDQWTGPAGNVYFYQTDQVAVSMSAKLRDTLAKIRDWSTPGSLTCIP
jgi:hypothetical protein